MNQNITPGRRGMTGWRTAGPLSPAAQLQMGLWGSDPDGWARFAEPHNQPLFAAVLDATGTGPGTRLLDLGCGTGLLLALAQARGATVTGLDVTPGLLTDRPGPAAHRRAVASRHM